MNKLFNMEIKNKNLFFGAGLLGLAFFIADRILKNLVLAGRIFGLKNYGLALSINFSGKIWEIIFWILATAVIFLLGYLIIKNICHPRESGDPEKIIPGSRVKPGMTTTLLLTSYFLLLFGAASNLLDRIKFGYVIDYLNFHFFYNNLADIMIWAGIIIYLVGVWYNRNKQNTKLN
ncbi:MAG: signal peptidase II [Patescibacteria group bacterium]|nr:signal peptidase II [Patescibacteria group bacterium]